MVKYCDTALNAADVLTKSLARVLHERHTDKLCGLDWDADHDADYQLGLPEDRRYCQTESST